MRPVVLSIAALDPGAGAGLLADVKTIEAQGCWATAVVTAVTAQTVSSVRSWQVVDASSIEAQVAAVFDDFAVAAVKVGLLGSAATVHAVAAALDARSLPIVVDPVLASSSGTRFADAACVVALRDVLMPRSTVITPNRAEAAQLAGILEARAEPAQLARALRALGANAVLLTGGQASGGRCEDLLFVDEAVHSISHPSIRTQTTHGTGCVHSAALAARLALGEALPLATRSASRFVAQAILNGVQYGCGGAPDPQWQAHTQTRRSVP